jgi:ribosomal protein RSM22 (predicted rRNA methylase)
VPGGVGEPQASQSFTLSVMRLPDDLSAKLSEIGALAPAGELKQAAKRLSDDYRAGSPARALRGETERLAYLMVRMPATYAAMRSALEASADAMPEFAPRTMLDLGSGPGTALWAACAVFPSLEKLAAIERDAGLASLARELADAAQNAAIREAEWRNGDLQSWNPAERYDLVIASYALGELSAENRRRVLLAAWAACDGSLAVVEPGTRRGFESIAQMRDWLIDAGAMLAAPCPHALECPMRAAGDWCHFSARLERSAEHRRLKQGDLGYEDEKFSYVIASKLPVRSPDARIVRHPMRYAGYTRLRLCTAEGLKDKTVTRSEKDRYREAKRSEWGDEWKSTRRTE